MSHILLGYANGMDYAPLSGGSWQTAYPLNNLLSPLLKKKARSLDLLATSTQFVMDLLASRSTLCFAAIATNLSPSATFRLTGSNDSSFATILYDSGLQSAGSQIPDLTWALPSSVVARYWRFELVDSLNAAGYIEIGRVFIGPALQPKTNLAKGAEIGYQSRSELVTSLGGVEYPDVQPLRRRFSFSLGHLNDYEAFVQVLQIQKYSDITSEVLLMTDNDEHAYRQQVNFLGRLGQLSPIQQPYAGMHQTAFEVLEIV